MLCKTHCVLHSAFVRALFGSFGEIGGNTWGTLSVFSGRCFERTLLRAVVGFVGAIVEFVGAMFCSLQLCLFRLGANYIPHLEYAG